jgi:hypothetical protein
MASNAFQSQVAAKAASAAYAEASNQCKAAQEAAENKAKAEIEAAKAAAAIEAAIEAAAIEAKAAAMDPDSTSDDSAPVDLELACVGLRREELKKRKLEALKNIETESARCENHKRLAEESSVKLISLNKIKDDIIQDINVYNTKLKRYLLG